MSEQMLYQTKTSINAVVYEFTNNGVVETRELVLDEEGVRGTRSMSLERARQGLIHVAGPIKLQPTPLEMSGLWPLINNSSTGTTLTDAMQDITVIKQLITASETSVGRIAKATIEGSPGKKLELGIDFIGYSTVMGSSSGSISGVGDITNSPYMMQDLGSGITIGGVTYSIDKFSLEIDNKIDPTFLQGQTATDLQSTGREVTLGISLRYNAAEAALLTVAQAGPSLTPVVATFAFTNGANSMSFSCPAVIAASKTVGATSKKLRLPLEYKALRVGASLEIVATFA